MFDWYAIKFLESSSNLKDVIKASLGRTPSTKIANDVVVCIKQGRLFFESAQTSPPDIQPLLFFYGIVGFAKAITLSRRLVAIDTLAQSHGLKDVSAHNSKIEDLMLKIENDGTFQAFNDASAPLGLIRYYDRSMPKWVSKPFDFIAPLAGKKISIKDIVSRIPGLETLYTKTFNEPANIWQIHLKYWGEYDGYTSLVIDDPELFTNRESLMALIRKWRDRWPFLNNWCIEEASHGSGKSILQFSNTDKSGIDEFSSDFLLEGDGRFRTQPGERMAYTSRGRIDFWTILPPVVGGIANRGPSIIEPVEGVYLNQFSFHFLGCYLLSSTVRYRPQTWQHAISKSVLPLQPADDRSLALIQKFLDVVLDVFPRLVVHSIDPKLD